jgi:hypothetical protein
VAAVCLGRPRREPSALRDYESVARRLVEEFDALALEDVSAQQIEVWRAGMGAGR